MLTDGGLVEGLILGPVERRTLRANIVQTVREAIRRQRLAPGMRLGVSLSTVREVLHQLAHERLVINSPHHRFFVAGFTLDDMVERPRQAKARSTGANQKGG